MWFWVVAALLTLVASLAILLPVMRPPKAEGVAAEFDIEVYRDQLAELERDAARGLISGSEAEEARAEIGRRILRLGDAAGATGGTAGRSRAARLLAAAAVLSVPLVSWGFYPLVGSPGLPGQPLAERLAKNPASSSIDELVARAERHLADNPADARGWEVLAPVYVRMNRFPDAVTAYRNAIRLAGSTPAREAGLGEALAAAAGGVVTAEAEAAFAAALALDPKSAKARLFLATALAQEGRKEEAAAGWRALLADLPSDSPWRGAAEEAIAALTVAPVAGGTPAGPTAAEMDAAAGLSEADRSAMIGTMVARLDERLRENPADAEGWQRLVRSYMVLGRKEEAADALRRGVAALGSDSEAARALGAFAAALGVTGAR